MRTWLALTALIALLGCKSTGVDKVSETAGSLREMQGAMGVAGQKIDSVVQSLAVLTETQGDMKKQYSDFGKAVKEMSSHADRLRKLREETQAKKEQYLVSWNDQLKNISSAELRARAEERRKKALDTFADLGKAADSIRNKYDPWSTHVTDIQTYLEHDLNAAGVSSVSKDVETVKKDSVPIKTELDVLTKQLGEIITSIEATRAESGS